MSLIDLQRKQIELKTMRMPNYVVGTSQEETISKKCGCQIYYSGGFNKTVKECFECKNQKSIFEEQLKEKLNSKGIKVQ